MTTEYSQVVWDNIKVLWYLQFPWRFLSISTLFLSLACGAISPVMPKRLLVPCVLCLVILLNANFFHPDIWRDIGDTQQFSGKLWDEQRSSALQDFWPATSSNLPVSFAPKVPQIRTGDGYVKLSNPPNYKVFIEPEYAKISFPIVYFPNWTSLVDGKEMPVFPDGDLGLVTARIPKGEHFVHLEFKDTLPRLLGNLISATVLLGIICKKLVSS